MKITFRGLAKLTLVLVYLVIVAGAVVRMTGSGMGCPDWPKCFGYYVPPTEEAELLWKADNDYKKGQVIIMDESLWLARKDFRTSSEYDAQNWEPYTKHDYALFNAAHTWTEYINRLLGALSGLGMLVMTFFSLRYWKTDRRITLISIAALVGIVFQAWLGATVVYSVLAPIKITLHMLMALVIVALLLYLIHRSRTSERDQKFDAGSFKLWLLILPLTLLQIVMGTQVRQMIDERVEELGYASKALWLQDAELVFYIHRSFSILLVLLHLIVAYRVYKYDLKYQKINPILILLLLEIISGIAMNYLNFPFGSQAAHLVIASLLFGFQFYIFLEMLKASYRHKSL